MHYFIDGYNLLFRLMHASDNLQSLREHIILDLSKKVALVKLDVSIVFDATSQVGGYTRSHFNEIEILFTAEGETADEFILEELKNSLNPHQETVITSDKKLAWQARHRFAHTESVEVFMSWLNKSYKNKLKQLKKPKTPSPPPTKKASPLKATSPHLPSAQAQVEECTDYYARIFETHYRELIQQEERVKQERSSHRPLPKKKRGSPKDPFQETLPPIEASTEMERWLKAFEERLKKSDPHAKY